MQRIGIVCSLVVALLIGVVNPLAVHGATTTGGIIPVYRIYNPNSGEHLFTPNKAEVDLLARKGWLPEGAAWGATTARAQLPVYRMYNPNAGDHFYTADRNEFAYLLRVGWKDDQYIIPAHAQGIPVYRMYNPNAKTGSHHYTLNWNEVTNLRQHGWRYEGVAFYADKVPPFAPAVPLGSVWDDLAQCESGGNWQINTGNGFYGGLQFSAKTWTSASQRVGLNIPYAHYATREEQIMAAKWLQEQYGWGQWPSCAKKLGLL